ncbi:MAG TPA: Omp28-related outer membrane protein [Flavipsychrobacter sp.]|nr:Omp28-related outer membrane protein [Flavipsychrobacter sp.]
MKKSLLVAGSAFLFFLNACKEIGPAIDFTPQVVDTFFKVRAYDTSYTDAVPTPQNKKMLIEEYTGVQCPNCPAGATILKNYDVANPGKIVIVALHSGSLTDRIPNKSKYYFANDDVQNMVNNYLGGNVNAKPAAAIDRTPQSNGLFIVNKNQWTSAINQRATATSPVNLTVTSRYDTAFKKVVINVKIAYTQQVTKKQNLSLWVLEDKIIDAQYDGTVTIDNYEHNHVFRDFITPVTGSAILSSVTTKSPGLVYERQLIYTPKFLGNASLDQWNLDNCKIVAVIHNDEQGDKEVAQVMEVNLK